MALTLVKGRDVYLDASGIVIPGTIVDVHWTFGDGGESCGTTCDHTYLGQTSGFTVGYTVTDDLGNVVTGSQGVTVGAAVYVSSTGTSSGAGTLASPYDMSSVFDGTHTGVIGAGGTVWIRGGTYAVALQQLWISGSSGNPAVARAVPGETVVLDGTLLQRGDYSECRGFRVTRTASGGEARSGVHLFAASPRAIDMVVDNAQISGIADYSSMAGTAVIDDNVLYNNGTLTNQHHGAYLQSQNSTFITRVGGNFAFNNWAYGFHNFSATTGQIHDMYLDGNVSWNNGQIANDRVDFSRPDFYTGGSGATNINYTNNYTYRSDSESVLATMVIGDGAGETNTDLVRTGNYCAGRLPFSRATFGGTVTEANNTNVDTASPPGTNVVYVRNSQSIGGRGIAVVYNWEGLATVAVDVSAILRRGDGYAIYDAHDLTASVASGTWDGSSTVALPMAAVAAPSPAYRTFTAPTSNGSQFHAYVVRRTSQSYTTAPTSPATGTTGWGRRVGATAIRAFKARGNPVRSEAGHTESTNPHLDTRDR